MINNDKRSTIFISHSSANIKVARAVRNTLEDLGHRPTLIDWLQFRSPDDDERILELLDGEIKNRDWLIFIETKESIASKWVKFEIEKAKEYGKEFYVINGDRFEGDSRYDIEKKIANCTQKFSQSIRAFISYSRNDEKQAQQVYEYLVSMGYEVWFDATNLTEGSNWAQEIRSNINEVVKWGVVVYLISNKSLSSYAREELNYTLSKNAPILPLLIEKIDLLPEELKRIQYIDMVNESPSRNGFYSIGIYMESLRKKLLNEYCE